MLTGKDIRAARKARGLNQTELGKLVGCGRHTVSYWENKTRLSRRCACADICEALGLAKRLLADWSWFRDHQQEAIDRRVEAELQRAREAEERRKATRRVPCGAKTRKGHPCRALSEPGKRRCRFHGGKSTGPRTEAGRKQIAEAQRRRWAAYRGQNNRD
ncbi:helix-turn-helix transcriptional regulator [Ruegeria sp. HKCCSA071]|uniref:helix-turn-helix domain-containing protein n=1 Tax=Ruegeria sp. HKCCSA071 TaxID=2794834 RepID=UPI001AE9E39E|nr:helix-turn-helix transcriptional regulator [Ruegeria sp. HKCCSA071]